MSGSGCGTLEFPQSNRVSQIAFGKKVPWVADQAIAHCGGNIRNAIKTLIATNEYLRRTRYF
jgi:hypothetical protein